MASPVCATAVAATLLEEDAIDDEVDDTVDDFPMFISVISSLFEGDEKSRIRGYVEDVVAHYSEEDFRRMFRVTPTTFRKLVDYLKDIPELQPAGPGRRVPISIEKQVLLTLWYVGGLDTICKIADRFGISESSVILCRDRVLSAIVKLRHKFIVWPDQQEMLEEANEFSQHNGFPGIIGAIDGTHIRIKQIPSRMLTGKEFTQYSYSVFVGMICSFHMHLQVMPVVAMTQEY